VSKITQVATDTILEMHLLFFIENARDPQHSVASAVSLLRPKMHNLTGYATELTRWGKIKVKTHLRKSEQERISGTEK